MKVSILGAGAMGSALTIPLCDNKNEVVLWGTKYDIKLLRLIEKGKKHPRLGVSLPKIEIAYPEQLDYALREADIILLAVSTRGALPVFRMIKNKIGDRILITVSKGLLEVNKKILTVPEAIWSEKEHKNKTVAITGPSIAREVAKRMPTKVVFSCADIKIAKKVAKVFSTRYYNIKVSNDIRGSEITSALKNVYSIAIAWIRGYEQANNFEMSNLKGVIATIAINELARIVETSGGKKSTVFGLSGFGDLIATFRGGRNGRLGELLGRGLSCKDALRELEKRGVGVVEGYETCKRAYKLVKASDKFPLLKNIYQVLYKNKKVKDVFEELIDYANR